MEHSLSSYPFLCLCQTGSEFALGTFGLINSGISFIAYSIVPKFIKNKFRKKAILLGGILYMEQFILLYLISVTLDY